MGVVTDHAAPDSYRGMNVHPIKEHLLLLVAGIALLFLGKSQFRLVSRSMGVVARRTGPLFNGPVYIGQGVGIFRMATETKGFARFLQGIVVI
jgi:hypothetical protein